MTVPLSENGYIMIYQLEDSDQNIETVIRS